MARARGAAQSLCAVHHRNRRARHSFPARPFAAPGSDAADHHPWLAGFGGRVSQGDRAFDRSDRARRQRRRCVSRRLSVIARLRLFGKADGHRLGRRSHRVKLGGVDGPPWISALWRAGRRLGIGDHDRDRRAGRRTLRRHSHHAGDVDAAQRGRAADARRSAGAERHSALRRLGFRIFQAAIDPATDTRLWLDGFAERAGRVDSGKVLGLDRLRRPPREHPWPR